MESETGLSLLYRVGDVVLRSNALDCVSPASLQRVLSDKESISVSALPLQTFETQSRPEVSYRRFESVGVRTIGPRRDLGMNRFRSRDKG